MKTIERAHTPKKLWEKVKLSKNYSKALDQLSDHLQFWPKRLVHKNKQRLTKIHQYLLRMRKLRLKTKPKLSVINKKVERRENRREIKARTAAKLEDSIEKELLERLQKGTYGDIYNFPTQEYNKVLNENEEEIDMELEDEEEEDNDEGKIEYVEDFEEDESDIEELDEMYNGADSDEGDSDSDEETSSLGKRKAGGKSSKGKRARKSGPYVEIEYEQEEEKPSEAVSASSW